MTNIPFNKLRIEILSEGIDLSAFDCSDQDLNDFLKEDALWYQRERLAVTRLVFLDDTLVGYFTIVNDSLEAGAVQKGDGHDGFEARKYPALKIARLATRNDYQGRGIGKGMLLKVFSIAIALSRYIGCRLITVDSKPDSVGFYQKFGFKLAHRKRRDTVPLYRDFHRAVEESDRTEREISDYVSE